MKVYNGLPQMTVALAEVKLDCFGCFPFDRDSVMLSHHEFVNVRVPAGSQADDEDTSYDLRPVVFPLKPMWNGEFDVPIVSVMKWLEQHIANEIPGCRDLEVSLPLQDDEVFRLFRGISEHIQPSFIVRYELNHRCLYRFFKFEDAVICDDINKYNWFELDLS